MTNEEIGKKIARAAEYNGQSEVIVEVDGQRYIGDVIDGSMDRADGLDDTDDYSCIVRTDSSADIEFLVSNDGYGWIGETAAISTGSSVTPERTTGDITRFEVLN